MDVFAVEAAMRKAAEHARAGRGPVLLEFRTYRFRAHSMFDPERYRDKAEVEARKKEGGPLTRFIARGKREHWFDEPDIEALERTVAAEIQASVDFAETSDWEPVADLARDVYTPWPAH